MRGCLTSLFVRWVTCPVTPRTRRIPTDKPRLGIKFLHWRRAFQRGVRSDASGVGYTLQLLPSSSLRHQPSIRRPCRPLCLASPDCSIHPNRFHYRGRIVAPRSPHALMRAQILVRFFEGIRRRLHIACSPLTAALYPHTRKCRLERRQVSDPVSSARGAGEHQIAM